MRDFGDDTHRLAGSRSVREVEKCRKRCAASFKRRERAFENAVGINGDGALLVSTSTSVKHSASLVTIRESVEIRMYLRNNKRSQRNSKKKKRKRWKNF